MKLPITPNQMWGARLLLGWSRVHLAAQSDTRASFIQKYEKEGRVAKLLFRERSFDGLAAVRATLEAAGVEFTNGGQPGVRLKRKDESNV